MTCEDCPYKDTIAMLVKSEEKNTETHKTFYKDFENLRTNDAVKDERDKNMFLMLQQIQKDVTELKGNPGRLWNVLISGGIVAIVTIVINLDF